MEKKRAFSQASLPAFELDVVSCRVCAYFMSQLRAGRPIVVPVLEQGFEAERLWTLERSGDRAIVQKHGWVRFVPMTGLAQG